MRRCTSHMRVVEGGSDDDDEAGRIRVHIGCTMTRKLREGRGLRLYRDRLDIRDISEDNLWILKPSCGQFGRGLLILDRPISTAILEDGVTAEDRFEKLCDIVFCSLGRGGQQKV